MDWKAAVVVLIVAVTGWVHGAPQIETADGQVVSVKIGQVATMTCVVRDLGAAELKWVFVKESLTIFIGNQKQTADPKYSLQQPDSKVFTLLISNTNVADQGAYKCEVNGTTESATFILNITDSSVSPNVNYTPDGPLNRTDCCKQQGVSDACLPVCAPTSTTGSSLNLAACVNDLAKFVSCGTDGRNHENCCARNGLPSECLSLCSSTSLNAPSIPTTCLSTAHFQTVVSCYQYGGALIPSPPESVSVIHSTKNSQSRLLINWKKPTYNPSAVLGYRVYYKKSTDSQFQSTLLQEPSSLLYKMSADLNTTYSIYVVAVGHHGSSQASETVEITTMATSTGSSSLNVDLCCAGSGVPKACQDQLCVPRLWDSFDTNTMLDCYDSLNNVFTCLSGRRDHSACCRTHNVPEECVPMCSGQPPAFNSSLAVCVPKLPVIEACVQQGLSTQPEAPDGVNLGTVTAHSATVQWVDPVSTGGKAVDMYYVQLRRGNDQAAWTTVMKVVGFAAELTNLTESENYAVQAIARIGNVSSLPSAVIRFRTLPETSPPFRPTVAHNLTQCCEDSGMPSVCSQGCQYRRNMTAYYKPVLDTCKFFIGTVLTCAADGRDHTPCCIGRGVKQDCHPMCQLNSPGFLNPAFFVCLNETAEIVTCFQEGLEDLVRMPEEVMVSNLTSHTITLQWKNPETGPTPEKYEVAYTSGSLTLKKTATDLVIVLQNLKASSSYSMTVTSHLNGTSSPPTNAITVMTPSDGTGSPFIPVLPTNVSRALWNNRTHCCQSSGIRKECQPLCLNQPSTTTNCSTENLKILACATDGRDHSSCCRQQGLTDTCVSLCSGHTYSNFTVRQAGCLGEDSMAIITSCLISNTGLLPAMPRGFTAVNGDKEVTLQWTGADNCGSSCVYDVHYWRTNTQNPNDYTTEEGVTSPHKVTGLVIGGQYTFTVTARGLNGSGPAAPWQTLYFGIMRPTIAIVQRPAGTTSIFESGVAVTLLCEVLNFPHQLSFSWHFRGSLMENRDRILLLDNLDRKAEGNYTCRASLEDFSLSATQYLNVRYAPEYSYHVVDNVKPNTGAQAVLEFWFRGHPLTDDLSKVWTKNGNPVQQSSRYSLSAQTMLEKGMTALKLKIQNVVQSDMGSYKCRATNQYGSAVAITVLMDPDYKPTPVPPSPEQKKNMTECCQARGVNEVCLPICSMAVSVEEAIANPTRYGFCLLYFNHLINCAADGGDHSLCCEKEGVHGDCMPLCRGQVPPTPDITNAPHLTKCVPDSPRIFTCMETGYAKIPTAPVKVKAVILGSGAINVSWTAPTRNADKVTSYTVYYNYTGQPQHQAETVTTSVGYSHVLTNLMSGRTYNIWLTAENKDVGRSQPSTMLSVSTAADTTKADELGGGAIAGIVIGVLVFVALVIVVVVFLVRRNGASKQKLMESVGFENTGYDNAVHIGQDYKKF